MTVKNTASAFCKYIYYVYAALPTAIKFERDMRETEKLGKIELNKTNG